MKIKTFLFCKYWHQS